MKAKFNRSKFKDSVKSDELKATDKAVEDIVSTGDKHYAGFLKIENGLNKFLLFPSHESILQIVDGNKDIKNEPFVAVKQLYWLPQEIEEKDDKGNVKKDKRGNPIVKVKNRPIFDARIHSEAKVDIVDVYIQCLKKQLEEEHGVDKEAEQTIRNEMMPIYGSYQQRVMGIVGKPGWIVYAQKIVGEQKIFGRLEFGKAVKMRLNELIALEEANSPIGSESNNPFTDIDGRRALLIKYNDKADDPKSYYMTEIDTSHDESKVLNTYPLTDSELEEFLQFPSLSSLYKSCYTQKTFDMAISGLKLFDDEHEFNVFSNQDFLDEVEQMRKLYPEPKEDDEVTEYSDNNEEGDDIFESMDRDEMKKFARDNKTGIIIHSKLTDEDLRDELRKWEKDENGQEKKEIPAQEPEETDTGKVLKTRSSGAGVKQAVSDGLSATERIAAIRKKVGIKK